MCNENPFSDNQLTFLSELNREVQMTSHLSREEKTLISHEDSQLNASVPRMLLILDTETTGLDPDREKCLEIGSILFHVGSRSVLAQHSFLLPVDSNEAETINKIPAEITRIPQPWQEGLTFLESLINCADLIVAHNAAFDRQWFGRHPLPVIDKPWLCTMEDVSWPENRQVRARTSIRELALAYEVPVWSIHRALSDCIYIAEVFRRVEDLDLLLTQALEPRKLFRAVISYEDRHLAKKAGFTWNSPVIGAWSRRLSEREVSSLSFNVVVVEDF